MTARDRVVDVGVKLHVRQWPGTAEPFVLIHGLSSNARTWDMVAARLSRAGHSVAVVDQRGHGLSEKPDRGYDLATLAEDLLRLNDALGWERPILVGQSMGGSVLVEFGSRHPGRSRGLGFVDGGFLDLRLGFGSTWERVAEALRPPDLIGTSRATLERELRGAHPDWSAKGIEATLANFEVLPDGTVRPWLSLERHMAILRSMWEQPARELFPRIEAPVLMCVAGKTQMPADRRRDMVAAAERRLRRVSTHWFADADHDIHVHQPERLAQTFLDARKGGIWEAQVGV